MTNTKKAIYVSGGMTNLPEFQFPLFDEVAAALRAEGWTVFSPAENDREVLAKAGIDDVTQVDGYAEGDVARYNASIGDTKDLFRWDFNVITNKCQAIAMLPGWETSTGARWERIVGEALGLVILEAHKEADGSWSFEPHEDQQHLTKLLKVAIADPTPGSRSDATAALQAVPARELLAEMRRRYPHAQFREPLDKIEAQLA